ncbi:MAG: hypothetical protein JW947_09345 [Sedimentisphaerales bacterium]|nr:hypothetical protein [Sedimentisphaerales bacterium]
MDTNMEHTELAPQGGSERRREQRLRYHWPVWFAENFNEALSQGQMVDVTSTAVAFTFRLNEYYPYVGQHLTARFSVPQFQPGEAFDMANFTRSGRIYRVDDVSSFTRRIVMQFASPLPFRPGEQAEGGAESQERLAAMMM